MCDLTQNLVISCASNKDAWPLPTEMIMRAKDELDSLKFGGEVVNDIGYEDDTVILAES